MHKGLGSFILGGMEIVVLREILILLACAIAIIPLCHRLKIPAIVGFLLTGILVGPGLLNLVPDTSRIDALAEIGVVMLLFVLGLEFSTEHLQDVRRAFWIGGGGQVLLTVGAVALLFSLGGASLPKALVIGFLVASSSTAVVLKLLQGRGEIDSPQGKTALGILLFQDLGIVPMMIAIPLLARQPGGAASLLPTVVKGGLLVILFAVAKLLVPRLVSVLIKTRIRETYVMSALLLCLGMAYLAHRFGFSPALGAFVAGVIISGSAVSHQLSSDIVPFKDLFSSIFFMSIGMLLNLGLAWSRVGTVLLLTASLVLLKLAVLLVVARMLRLPGRVSLIVGITLAQVGEFSFVMARLSRASGVLSAEEVQLFMVVAVFSILLTPFWVERVPALALRLQLRCWKDEPAAPVAGGAIGRQGHVVIAGYGLNGQNLASVLKSASIPFVVIELDYGLVKRCQDADHPVILGDVCSRDILAAAGTPRAKAFVGAISDPQAIKTALGLVLAMNPRIKSIIRTRTVGEIDELYRIGASQVIPEEFETSIEIFTRTLAEYHIPRNIINAQIEIIRSEGYAMMRSAAPDRRFGQKIVELLTMGTVENYMVLSGQRGVGKTLRELDIRKRTGATVIALVRDDKPLVSPPPDTTLRERDILVLVGDHRGIDEALALLRMGKDEANE